ncbi:MAG: SufS family cysteine desulfurase, partial [Chloroflexi bacterium]|nr:SufS family cysteine desulfurase [Chloroflexota bacterium]
IHAASPREIVFVRNATEAVNLVAFAWGRKNIKAGDEILLTEMEHHSNLVPWQELAKEKEAKLKFIPFDEQGRLVLDSLDKLLTEKTRLVGVTLMSNVLGTINPVRHIADLAHARGALVIIDGAQGVCHLPVDACELDCDFLAISGHKMLGPTGIGVLYARRSLLESMDPFNSGGSMIKEVWWEEARWNELPWKFEAGTPSIAEGIGLGVAVDYLSKVGMEKIRTHEEQLAAYTLERLEEIPGLEIYGPPAEERGGLVAFNLEGVHSHDLATVLDYEGIAVRAGHHCAMPLHTKLGVLATTRASFYLYNTQEEADRLAGALEKARNFFAGKKSE